MEQTMAAYLIANIEITDSAGFARYGQAVPPVVAAHGGRYLVRGGVVSKQEGDLDPQRLVIIEFPTLDDAHRFYGSADYAPLLELRTKSTKSSVVIAEGVPALG